MEGKIFIVVNLTVEGLHCWPKCDIEQVEFLKNKHRHLFFITAKKRVNDEDREIEIINFKASLHEFLRSLYPHTGSAIDFGANSCEMIAKQLSEEFGLAYCRVLEDNENGAEYESMDR